MSRSSRTFLVVVLAVLAAGFSGPKAARAQEVEPAQTPGTAATESEPDALREQSIYIPYEKLQRVFEEHGRGVFLPYEQFQELWRAARQKDDPAIAPKPPVAAVIAGIDNVATVERDVVRVRARLTIDVLVEGWTEVPLRLADAAITSATIGDAPARILGGPAEGYRLLVEHKGNEPAQVELQLEYARAIGKSPGQNSVSFQAPQAPVSRWEVRIPEPGVKVDIHPLIAATEAPGEPGDDEPDTPADQTVVLAFVGAAPVVRIDWTPRAEGAKGLEALASVEARHQVWITEGTTRNRVQVDYSIRRAELARLEIEAPAGQKVVNVFDANVRQWSIEQPEEGGPQRIVVDLFEPAKDSQQVTVELEQFVEDGQVEIGIPAVRALNVGRQQGIVVVAVAEGFRAEATATAGLLQVDPSDLPQAVRGGAWTFAFRYAAVPFDLTLAVEKLEPRISADTLVEATVQPERLVIDATIAYTIERAGVFRFDVDIPTGFRVSRVTGRQFQQFAAAVVDSHLVEPGEAPKLVVNLAKKAQGPVGLAVRLERDLSEPDLLSPTGKAAEIPLPIPRPSPEGIERSVGRLIVYAPESLRVLPAERAGLREIGLAEALQAIPSAGDSSGDTSPVLAFAFTGEPASLELAAERRRPQVTVRQLLVARVEEGVVKYRATLLYEVRYSSVKALRLDVPADLAADVRIETAGFREKTIEPPPKDVADGYVAWQISGEAELLGEGRIELVWDDELGTLEVGKPADIDIPRLVPREVHRAWGQIVLAKVETIDVAPTGEPAGLRGIDPQQDLILPVPGAARAMEFQNDWQLTVAATRYQLEELKRTSIERSVVQAVAARSNELGVQALYRMRSARQRLEVKLPESVRFDAQPLRINGRPVPLEQGAEGTYFLPLVDVEADGEFVLELRYAVPDPVAGPGARIVLPVFPHEPASQKTYLCVYLPREWAMLGATGPWTPEPGADGSLGAAAGPHRPGQLIKWVIEGIATEGDPHGSFPTDGRPYVFSTLRPAASPEGDLRVYATDETWLHGAVFALVLLGGVVLLPFRFPSRVITVGLAVGVLVLLAVFTPVFAGRVIDEAFALAVFLVLVLWAVWFAMRAWPKLVVGAGGMTAALACGARGWMSGGKKPAEAAPAAEPGPREKGPALDQQDAAPPGGQASKGDPSSTDAEKEGGPAHE